MTRKWTEKEIDQLNQQTEKVCLKTLNRLYLKLNAKNEPADETNEGGKTLSQEGKNFLLSRDQISSATSVTCFEYQTSHLVIDFGLLTQKLSILYTLLHI